MEFRQQGQAFAVLLPRRSLLVMAGPARYSWQHYIPHRKADWVNSCLLPRASQRVSFTFRQVLLLPMQRDANCRHGVMVNDDRQVSSHPACISTGQDL